MMIISDIRIQKVNDNIELSAKIQPNNGIIHEDNSRVRFLVPKIVEPLSFTADPFLAGFLIPCMYAEENLHIEGSISRLLLQSVTTIQKIMKTWYSQLSEISVTSTETHDNITLRKNNFGRGSFLSAGVDSWYSFLKNKDEITHLILIQGFDIKSENFELYQQTKNCINMVANSFKKQVITVKTNLRELADMRNGIWGKKYPGDFWGAMYFGSALAAVGLCLQGIVQSSIIPSSYTYLDLHPWGSHPLLDPLWSTENMLFIHHGSDSARIDKIKHITKSKIALSNLRVCYSNVAGRYNCCQCEKCNRTMLALRVFDVLDEAKSFDMPLDLNLVKRRHLPHHCKIFYREILDEALKNGNSEVADAIRIALGEKLSFVRLVSTIWYNLPPWMSSKVPKSLVTTIKRAILK
jgi:hypothetical protein